MKQFALIAFLFFFPNPVFAAKIGQYYGDGNKLYSDLQFCISLGHNVPSALIDSTRALDYGKCNFGHGIIWGVSDYLKIYESLEICIPDSVNGFQVFDVVYEWLQSNPATRHHAAPMLIKQAVQNAWPCPE